MQSTRDIFNALSRSDEKTPRKAGNDALSAEEEKILFHSSSDKPKPKSKPNLASSDKPTLASSDGFEFTDTYVFNPSVKRSKNASSQKAKQVNASLNVLEEPGQPQKRKRSFCNIQ